MGKNLNYPQKIFQLPTHSSKQCSVRISSIWSCSSPTYSMVGAEILHLDSNNSHEGSTDWNAPGSSCSLLISLQVFSGSSQLHGYAQSHLGLRGALLLHFCLQGQILGETAECRGSHHRGRCAICRGLHLMRHMGTL